MSNYLFFCLIREINVIKIKIGHINNIRSNKIINFKTKREIYETNFLPIIAAETGKLG